MRAGFCLDLSERWSTHDGFEAADVGFDGLMGCTFGEDATVLHGRYSTNNGKL